MKKFLFFVTISVIALSVMVSSHAFAATTQYKVPVISDFSGAWAELFKTWIPMHKAVFAWWNDNIGKGLGVELVVKHYDGRNDPSTIASMWPGILSECNPIIALGGGGADVAALQQRLPKDKVPVFYGTASYGYGWVPNQWLFQVRPTFTHEWLAAFVWFAEKHPEKKPVRLAFLSCQIPPALDIVKGFEKYFEEVLEPKGIGKIVAKEFTDVNPVDVSSQVKKIVDAKADIVVGVVTTAMSAAYIRACELQGVNIPTIAAPFHTIWAYARAMKTYKPFEGHMVSAAHASVTDKQSRGYKFFTVLKEKYKLKEEDWNPQTMVALNQSILALRAYERAAKKVGVAKLNGQAVYDAMFAGPFTFEDLMGTLPTLEFTKEAPFSTKDLKVMIETVKNGEYIQATKEWVTVPPDIKKW